MAQESIKNLTNPNREAQLGGSAPIPPGWREHRWVGGRWSLLIWADKARGRTRQEERVHLVDLFAPHPARSGCSSCLPTRSKGTSPSLGCRCEVATPSPLHLAMSVREREQRRTLGERHRCSGRGGPRLSRRGAI